MGLINTLFVALFESAVWLGFSVWAHSRRLTLIWKKTDTDLHCEKIADYYELLEVHPKASPEVIARAYRVLVSRYHPDLYPSDQRGWAEEMMKRVNEAYHVLSDPQKRAAFDAAFAAQLNRRSRISVTIVSPPATPRIPPPEAVVAEVKGCAFHASRSPVSLCPSCRRKICEKCLVLRNGRIYCTECDPQSVKAASAPMPRKGTLDKPQGKSSWRVVQVLSVFEGSLSLAVAAALATWLYSFVGPKLVHDKGMPWMTFALCILAGSVSAIALFVLPQVGRALWWKGPAKPFRPFVMLMVAAVVIPGSFKVNATSRGVRQHAGISEDESLGNQWLREFKGSFPARSRTKKDLLCRLKSSPDVAWHWLSGKAGGKARAEKGLDAGKECSFPEDLSPDRVNRARHFARKFLATRCSKRDDHKANRAACLHFLVWAETKRPSPRGVSVSKEARECLEIASASDQKADCLYYLARKAYHHREFASLQRCREEFSQVAPEDPRLAHVDKWMRSLPGVRGETRAVYAMAENASRREDPASLHDLRHKLARLSPHDTRVTVLDRWTRVASVYDLMRHRGSSDRVVREGLKTLNWDLAQQDPETLEKLAYDLGKYLYQRRHGDGLKQLVEQYSTVSRLQRYKSQLKVWAFRLPPPALATAESAAASSG